MYTRLLVFIVLLQCLLANRTYQNIHGNTNLSGLFCPVFTPMNEYGALNLSIIPEYAKYIKKSGLDGVVVAGIRGEGFNLGMNEKKKLISAWVSAGKPLGIKIIAEIGGILVPDIIEMARHAIAVKVDGVMVLPPSNYIIIPSPEIFAIAIEDLAQVTKSLPIIYDHEIYGALEHVHLPEYFIKASEEVPQFKGMKVNIRDAMLITATTKIRKNQELFIFECEAFASGTLLGYDSFITPCTCLFPDIVKKVIVSVKSGDIATARRNQEKLNKLSAVILSQGTDYITPLKLSFEIITGINVGPTRFPLQPVPQKGVTAIKAILKHFGIKIAIDI